MPVQRILIEAPWGQIQARTVAASAELPVLVLLHQSPLSARNYDALLPHLSAFCRPDAIDTPGYGGSDAPPAAWEVRDYAAVVWRVADALAASSIALFGRATGAVFALDAALQAPQRVSSLVLHGLPVYTPEERAQRLANFAPSYVLDAAGAHLAWIWARIRGEYPHLEPELATRFVADYLAAGPDFAQSYRAIFRHDLPARVLGRQLPSTVLIGGTADRIGFMHPRACALFADARAELIAGADDFVAERAPADFAALLARALASASA